MATATRKAKPSKPRTSLADFRAGNAIVRARYDAAQTTDENTRHWANSDALSAASAHDPGVRRTLRMRSRYEIANCPLARSILAKLANFTVGTGPRLQLKTSNREYNRAVSMAFTRWAISTKWARKLWLMRYSKAMNGEAFGMFFTNPPTRSFAQPVSLDFQVIEADRVADPSMTPNMDADGIVFDDWGNPIAYRVLKSHPGARIHTGFPQDTDTVSAENMVHYFAIERAGQLRGIPEITAGLPYLAMRRRYILAVLAAAETAADLAGVIKTQSSPEDPANLVPLDAVEIERRMLMTLPEGWDIQQFKAEQPTTGLEMFDHVIIREIGRCVNMPFGIAAGDSSNYNFASGKLDHLPWFQTVTIEQDQIEDTVARPTFERWYAEASRIPGFLPPLPDDMAPMTVPDHQWFWDGQDLLDPREAGAKEKGLAAGFETHAGIFARRGLDPVEQWEAEAELLGITLDEYRQKIMDKVFGAAAEPDAESQAAETAEAVAELLKRN